MAWFIAQEKSERPVVLPPPNQKIGHTAVEWFESEPGTAVILCTGGTVDDRWLAEALVREELAACGIKQARFSFDGNNRDFSTRKSLKWDFYLAGEGQSWDIRQVDARPLEDGRRQIKDLELRRPFYYHPETSTVLIGPAGAYHAQIEHHLKGLPNPLMRAQGYVMLDTGEVGNFGLRGRDENGKSIYQDMAGHPVNKAVAEYLGPEYWSVDEGKPKLNPFQAKTSHWNDIMAKAKRLIQSGNVTLLRNGFNIIVAHVIGDHGEYTCEISRDDPQSRAITQWTCECPWDQYAFQRTRKWKKYEARPCAHVLAAYWSSLGAPLDEDYEPGAGAPPTGPMGPAPSVTPGGGVMAPDGFQPPEGMGQMPPGQMPPAPGGGVPGPMPQNPGMPPAPMPSQLPPLMAPPGGNQVIPPFPMDPAQLQLPVSVPGGRPGPYPANPVQQPGTFSKRISMAERSGIPELDAAIEEFMAGPFKSGLTNETDLNSYRDPRHAWGNCEIVAEAFCDFLKARGFKAYVTTDEAKAFYPDAQDSHAIGAGDFAYPEHALVSVYGYGAMPIEIDFTASQYGYTEFPKVHSTFSHVVKLFGGSAQEFAPGMSARINEATLGQSEGREGATDAGQWMEVPKNSIVEVFDVDPTTGWVEILYPLKGGAMTSYHVRCYVEPEKLTPLPDRHSPFQNPRT